jgi:uncharacterized protein YkwD
MPFSARQLSLAISAGVLVALPGTLLLGPKHVDSPTTLTAVRVDTHQPPHDYYTIPRHALVIIQPTPEPTAPPAPAPVVARPAPPPPAPPRPPVAIGSGQQALINADRAAAGLGPLTWNSCLASVAYQNAQRMAAQGFISHTNGVQLDLGCRLGNRTGENVGYTSAGISDGQLNSMFMNSPGHRANIMGPFHYVGTAWVVAANGYGYIAVEFG